MGDPKGWDRADLSCFSVQPVPGWLRARGAQGGPVDQGTPVAGGEKWEMRSEPLVEGLKCQGYA